MKTIKDRGALLCAVVALVMTLVAWVHDDGGRSQQLADVSAQVQTIETQMQHIQQELDQYLLVHDGH